MEHLELLSMLNVTTVQIPEAVLLLILLAAISLFAFFSIVIRYHLKRYSLNKAVAILSELVYFTVSLVLILFMITSFIRI